MAYDLFFIGSFAEIVALQIGGQATEALIVYADVGSDITLGSNSISKYL